MGVKSSHFYYIGDLNFSNMKKISGFLFFAILFTGCSSNKGTEEFNPKTSAQIKSGLETFFENYQWKDNGTRKEPLIAVTSGEVARLKAAWKGSGAEHDVLANRFARVEKAMMEPVSFPPEGGQHNQWYQCSSCQLGLLTVDASHHKCPKCEKVYSGFPYDNVLFSRQHSRNFSLAEDAAWAWTVTGDKKYADFAASVLLGYAERYLNYPMVHAQVNDKSIDVAAEKNGKYSSAGHIAEQTLNEAGLMIPLVTAYDLIFDSGVLSSDEKRKIEEDLIRAMADCINVHKTGKSNWQTWHNAALLYAGTVLGDKQMVKQAMLDNENGFVTQMNISVTPEGMWYENSWGYHYYTLSALTLIAEGGKRLGMDIYSHELLRKMYLLAFDYLMADGSLPRFGDAVNDSPKNHSVNEKAYAVYKDSRLLATLPAEPTWEMIMTGRKADNETVQLQSVSSLIPGAGHAILATNGPGKLTAALTFGPYGGFHGHYDKLSFVFFGYGKELGVDPGRAASQAYRLPIHQEWYKATTGHNAVLVDGIPQKEAGGQLLAFESSASYAAVSAFAGPAFDNVTHHRFLLLGPTYLLVVDELKATDGKEHTFDWLYHNKGQNAVCTLPVSKAKLLPVPAGYSYLQNLAAFKAGNEEPVEVKFTDGEITTNLMMPGHQGDEIFTATGPLTSVEDRVPVMIVRRKGRNVHFITVIEPVPQQKEPDIRGLSMIPGSSLSIGIQRSDGSDIVTFEGESLGNFTVINKSESAGESVVLKSEEGK